MTLSETPPISSQISGFLAFVLSVLHNGKLNKDRQRGGGSWKRLYEETHRSEKGQDVSKWSSECSALAATRTITAFGCPILPSKGSPWVISLFHTFKGDGEVILCLGQP